MGSCPQGSNWVTCLLYLSQYSDIWINKDNELPSFGAESFSVTISGFSGGSYLATQIDVIYSDLIKGVGMIEGGSYGGQLLLDSLSNDTQLSIDTAKQMESSNLISPLKNAIGKPIWIHSGTSDIWLPNIKQQNQRDFYKYFGANVTFVQTNYGHTIPKIREEFCESQGGVYAVSCGYDAVGEMLKTLLTGLKVGRIDNFQPMYLNWLKDKKGVLRKFSQYSLTDASIFDFSGIEEFGYIFYPKQCVDGSTICKLHINMHGCTHTVLASPDGFNLLTQYGFNEYAVSNNIIVVFPQAKFSLVYNQHTCWDFYGYSSFGNGQQYLTKNGVQAKFIKNIIDRITKPIDFTKYRYLTSNLLEYNKEQNWWEQTNRFLISLPQNMILFLFNLFVTGTYGQSAISYNFYDQLYTYIMGPDWQYLTD